MSERNLDVISMNVRMNKQQICTIDMGFKIASRDELDKVAEKLKMIEGIIDVQRTRG